VRTVFTIAVTLVFVYGLASLGKMEKKRDPEVLNLSSKFDVVFQSM
jgi:hypothetical protein